MAKREPPYQRNCTNVPTRLPEHERCDIDEERLQDAVNRLLHETDDDRMYIVPDFLKDVPRWIDKSELPELDRAGPERCWNCGSQYVMDEPAERGRELALVGEDGNPGYDPCPPGKYNIESCTCCGCPGCYNKSIYARQNKSPTYRCRNPDCGLEFMNPIELPLDPDDVPRRLYFYCGSCGEPNLAPIKGIPQLLREL